MRARFTKLGATLAALAALAVGGSALASAAGNGSQPAKAPAAVQKAGAVAPDPGQQGDTDTIQDQSGADSASGAAESSANESTAAESGSEVAGNDGPGGWADEPGNPNADTQQQGEH